MVQLISEYGPIVTSEHKQWYARYVKMQPMDVYINKNRKLYETEWKLPAGHDSIRAM